GLELFSNSFDDSLAVLKSQVKELANSGDVDKIAQIQLFVPIMKKIQSLQSDFNNYLNTMANSDKKDCDEIDDFDKDIENKNSIDYLKYSVDSTIPHSLDEDFEHKRPCAFLLNGQKYQADNWQDVLTNLCNILASDNKKAFDELVDNNIFSGRKVKYFGKTYNPKKNKLIKNTDVYVWVNLSANMIRKLIRKILVQFGIKPSTFSVYFRADYSSLHE
ncbi:MAG: hypothetical protein ACI4I6_03065, partial [Hominimerdicola sp.]